MAHRPLLPHALLWLVVGSTLGCNSSSEEHSAVSLRGEALIDESLSLNASELQPVIVNLRVPEDTLEARRPQIEAAQATLLAKAIPGFTLSRRYRHVAALAGQATAQAIEQLANDPGVFFVQRDARGGGQLKEAVPAIGGDQARTLYGVTGRGVRVAVLDTGIDTDHPDLKEALVAQHCFTQFACPGFGSESTSAEDDHGHGSNVAGIIASRGVVAPRGFAPASELIAVKINDANDSGQESDWIAGMDWLLDNLATQKVKLVNLSIGTTALYAGGVAATCDRAHPAMASAIKRLVDAGVTVFAATGNRGSSTSMPAPACNTGVIAVGAVYDSAVGKQPPANVGTTYAARWGSSFANCSDANAQFDQIACFTNSTARMDLLAPGAPILSDSLRGRTELYWGTSQASPAAVGVAALLLECDPTLTPARIKQILQSTGVPRTDMRNGVSAPSLRALAAVQAVCSEGDGGAPSVDAGPATVDAGANDAAAGSEAGTIGTRPDAAVGSDAGAPVNDADTAAPGPWTGTPSAPLDASISPVTTDAGVVPGAGTGAGEDDGCACAAAGRTRASTPLRAWLCGLGCALALALRRRRRQTTP